MENVFLLVRLSAGTMKHQQIHARLVIIYAKIVKIHHRIVLLVKVLNEQETTALVQIGQINII